ncbi:putative cytochrome P450 [Xylariales sp. PMI_506]|nr:putative cytochrome P450 [Xylariales sp. PMI_506]
MDNITTAGDRLHPIPWNAINIPAILGTLAIVVFIYAIGIFIYNLYFHPLARFPGPIIWRATRLAYVIRMNQGNLAFDLLGLHAKYGSIVRIAPNELSFQEPQAWKDIYGHRVGAAHGAEEMDKYHTFYRTKGEVLSISSGDREYHGLLRRQLAHGFSERALREQEGIIGSYVDLLIQRLHEACTDNVKVDPMTGQPSKRALDIKEWYNWTTFDVIGDLTFGAPFGSLERAKTDPWVEAINGSIRFLGIINGVKHMGLESTFIWLVKLLNTNRAEHDRNMMDKLHRRVSLELERPDIIEGLLKKKDEWGLSMHHLQANSSSVLIAGSETTSSMLSGVTFLLLTNPEALRKVTEEVREKFSREEDITLTSVSCLTYMLACLNEALRSYPPVPFGMPRQVPKGGGTILGQFVPEDTVVAIWHWASYHSAKHFTKPFEYHPERFLGDPEFANDSFDMLQPFSQGPRNCIGRHLAYAEMRLVLARMLFNFDISLVDDEVNKKWIHHKSYVLWDKPPLYVHLTPRDK